MNSHQTILLQTELFYESPVGRYFSQNNVSDRIYNIKFPHPDSRQHKFKSFTVNGLRISTALYCWLRSLALFITFYYILLHIKKVRYFYEAFVKHNWILTRTTFCLQLVVWIASGSNAVILCMLNCSHARIVRPFLAVDFLTPTYLLPK